MWAQQKVAGEILEGVATLDLIGNIEENGGGAFDCHLQPALEAGLGPGRRVVKLPDGYNPWLLLTDPGSPWRRSKSKRS